MPYRSLHALQSWIDEFAASTRVANQIRVMPQDGSDGSDTGLVGMRLSNSPTEIYIEPPRGSETLWTVTFEPREEPVTVAAVDVQAWVDELAVLAALCTFLQEKSDAWLAEHRAETDEAPD